MKRKFTAREVEDLVWNGIETIEGENRRWSRTNITIVKIDEKFYQLEWEEGLTEMQENRFDDQEADEVIQVEETVVVKKWKIKKEEK